MEKAAIEIETEIIIETSRRLSPSCCGSPQTSLSPLRECSKSEYHSSRNDLENILRPFKLDQVLTCHNTSRAIVYTFHLSFSTVFTHFSFFSRPSASINSISLLKSLHLSPLSRPFTRSMHERTIPYSLSHSLSHSAVSGRSLLWCYPLTGMADSGSPQLIATLVAPCKSSLVRDIEVKAESMLLLSALYGVKSNLMLSILTISSHPSAPSLTLSISLSLSISHPLSLHLSLPLLITPPNSITLHLSLTL